MVQTMRQVAREDIRQIAELDLDVAERDRISRAQEMVA